MTAELVAPELPAFPSGTESASVAKYGNIRRIQRLPSGVPDHERGEARADGSALTPSHDLFRELSKLGHANKTTKNSVETYDK